MPSNETWWWIGIGTGVAALAGAGAALVYRAKKKPPRLGQPGLEGTGLPPVPPTPAPDPMDALGLKTPGPDLRKEICRQWKAGQHKPDWRPELNQIVRKEIDKQIEAAGITLPFDFGDDVKILEDAQFNVATSTLAAMCPQVPAPRNEKELQYYYENEGIYWRQLWDLLAGWSWNVLLGAGT